MGNLIRIGETVINLDCIQSIDGNSVERGGNGIAVVRLKKGRIRHFGGEDGDAIRALIRTIPAFPPPEESPGEAAGAERPPGPLGWSGGDTPEAEPREGPRINHGRE